MFLRKSILAVLVIIMTIFCAYKGVSAEVLVGPALSVDGSYNSNPFLRGVGQDIDEDYVFTISPEIGARSEGRSVELTGLYRADAIFYSHEPVFNYIAHTADLGAGVEMSKKTSLGVNDHFTFTKDSLTAFGEGIQTARTDITANTASVNVDHDLGKDTSLSASYSNSSYKFGDDTLVDTRTDSADLSLSHTLMPGRSVSASYAYANYTFDAAGGPTTTETHSLSTDFTTELIRDLALDLSIGAVYTPERSDDADLTAGAGLTWSFRDSAIALKYLRSVASAQGLAQEVTISDMGYLSATHDLTEDVDVRLAGDLRKTRSKPSRAVDLTSYSTDLSVNWRVYQWLAASISYTRFVQWVDGGVANDLKRDRVGVNLRFTPEKWRL